MSAQRTCAKVSTRETEDEAEYSSTKFKTTVKLQPIERDVMIDDEIVVEEQKQEEKQQQDNVLPIATMDDENLDDIVTSHEITTHEISVIEMTTQIDVEHEEIIPETEVEVEAELDGVLETTAQVDIDKEEILTDITITKQQEVYSLLEMTTQIDIDNEQVIISENETQVEAELDSVLETTAQVDINREEILQDITITKQQEIYSLLEMTTQIGVDNEEIIKPENETEVESELDCVLEITDQVDIEHEVVLPEKQLNKEPEIHSLLELTTQIDVDNEIVLPESEAELIKPVDQVEVEAELDSVLETTAQVDIDREEVLHDVTVTQPAAPVPLESLMALTAPPPVDEKESSASEEESEDSDKESNSEKETSESDGSYVSTEEDVEKEKVFVPSFNIDIRRAPKLGEIYKAPENEAISSDDDVEEESSSIKQTYDVHKYLSFELDDGTEEDADDLPNDKPIEISSYFADDVTEPEPAETSHAHEVAGPVSIEFNLVPSDYQGASENEADLGHASDTISHLDALGVPDVNDDELTDAELSDREKDRLKRKDMLAQELSQISSGFTSSYGFTKVEDEVEKTEESSESEEEPVVIGRLKIPDLFSSTPKTADEPPKRQMSIPEPAPVDESVKEEARKIGRYVLPKENEHDELVFDKKEPPIDETPTPGVEVETLVEKEAAVEIDVVVEEETLVAENIREVEAEVTTFDIDITPDVVTEVETAPVDDFEIIDVVQKDDDKLQFPQVSKLVFEFDTKPEEKEPVEDSPKTPAEPEFEVDPAVKEEALKYGKFVLPNENEHEIIIFDKLVVPIPLDEDETPTEIIAPAKEELVVELAVETVESSPSESAAQEEASKSESDDGFVELDVPSGIEDESEKDVLSVERKLEVPGDEEEMSADQLPVAMMGPTLIEQQRSVDEYIATMYGVAVVAPTTPDVSFVEPTEPEVEEQEQDEIPVEDVPMSFVPALRRQSTEPQLLVNSLYLSHTSDQAINEEGPLGKVTIPEVFIAPDKVEEPEKESPETVEKPVDVEFIKDAQKVGKYVLPGPEDEEIIIFDQRTSYIFPTEKETEELSEPQEDTLAVEVKHDVFTVVETPEFVLIDQPAEDEPLSEPCVESFEVIEVEQQVIDIKPVEDTKPVDDTKPEVLEEEDVLAASRDLPEEDIDVQITECFEFLDQIEDPDKIKRQEIKRKIFEELEKEKASQPTEIVDDEINEENIVAEIDVEQESSTEVVIITTEVEKDTVREISEQQESSTEIIEIITTEIEKEITPEVEDTQESSTEVIVTTDIDEEIAPAVEDVKEPSTVVITADITESEESVEEIVDTVEINAENIQGAPIYDEVKAEIVEPLDTYSEDIKNAGHIHIVDYKPEELSEIHKDFVAYEYDTRLATATEVWYEQNISLSRTESDTDKPVVDQLPTEKVDEVFADTTSKTLDVASEDKTPDECYAETIDIVEVIQKLDDIAPVDDVTYESDKEDVSVIPDASVESVPVYKLDVTDDKDEDTEVLPLQEVEVEVTEDKTLTTYDKLEIEESELPVETTVVIEEEEISEEVEETTEKEPTEIIVVIETHEADLKDISVEPISLEVAVETETSHETIDITLKHEDVHIESVEGELTDKEDVMPVATESEEVVEETTVETSKEEVKVIDEESPLPTKSIIVIEEEEVKENLEDATEKEPSLTSEVIETFEVDVKETEIESTLVEVKEETKPTDETIDITLKHQDVHIESVEGELTDKEDVMPVATESEELVEETTLDETKEEVIIVDEESPLPTKSVIVIEEEVIIESSEKETEKEPSPITEVVETYDADVKETEIESTLIEVKEESTDKTIDVTLKQEDVHIVTVEGELTDKEDVLPVATESEEEETTVETIKEQIPVKDEESPLPVSIEVKEEETVVPIVEEETVLKESEEPVKPIVIVEEEEITEVVERKTEEEPTHIIEHVETIETDVKEIEELDGEGVEDELSEEEDVMALQRRLDDQVEEESILPVALEVKEEETAVQIVEEETILKESEEPVKPIVIVEEEEITEVIERKTEEEPTNLIEHVETIEIDVKEIEELDGEGVEDELSEEEDVMALQRRLDDRIEEEPIMPYTIRDAVFTIHTGDASIDEKTADLYIWQEHVTVDYDATEVREDIDDIPAAMESEEKEEEPLVLNTTHVEVVTRSIEDNEDLEPTGVDIKLQQDNIHVDGVTAELTEDVDFVPSAIEVEDREEIPPTVETIPDEVETLSEKEEGLPEESADVHLDHEEIEIKGVTADLSDEFEPIVDSMESEEKEEPIETEVTPDIVQRAVAEDETLSEESADVHLQQEEIDIKGTDAELTEEFEPVVESLEVQDREEPITLETAADVVETIHEKDDTPNEIDINVMTHDEVSIGGTTAEITDEFETVVESMENEEEEEETLPEKVVVITEIEEKFEDISIEEVKQDKVVSDKEEPIESADEERQIIEPKQPIEIEEEETVVLDIRGVEEEPAYLDDVIALERSVDEIAPEIKDDLPAPIAEEVPKEVPEEVPEEVHEEVHEEATEVKEVLDEVLAEVIITKDVQEEIDEILKKLKEYDDVLSVERCLDQIITMVEENESESAPLVVADITEEEPVTIITDVLVENEAYIEFEDKVKEEVDTVEEKLPEPSVVDTFIEEKEVELKVVTIDIPDEIETKSIDVDSVETHEDVILIETSEDVEATLGEIVTVIVSEEDKPVPSVIEVGKDLSIIEVEDEESSPVETELKDTSESVEIAVDTTPVEPDVESHPVLDEVQTIHVVMDTDPTIETDDELEEEELKEVSTDVVAIPVDDARETSDIEIEEEPTAPVVVTIIEEDILVDSVDEVEEAPKETLNDIADVESTMDEIITIIDTKEELIDTVVSDVVEEEEPTAVDVDIVEDEVTKDKQIFSDEEDVENTVHEIITIVETKEELVDTVVSDIVEEVEPTAVDVDIVEEEVVKDEQIFSDEETVESTVHEIITIVGTKEQLVDTVVSDETDDEQPAIIEACIVKDEVLEEPIFSEHEEDVESTVHEIITIVETKEELPTPVVIEEVKPKEVDVDVVIAEDVKDEQIFSDEEADVETTVHEIITIVETKDVLDEVVAEVVEKEEPTVVVEEIKEEPQFDDDILAVESTVDEIVTIVEIKETIPVAEDVLDDIVTEVVEKEEPVVIAEEITEEPELTDDILDVETTVDEIVTIIEVKETVAVTEDVLDEIVTDIIEKEEPTVLADEITEEPESTDDTLAIESTIDEIVTIIETKEVIPVAEDVLDDIVTEVVQKEEPAVVADEITEEPESTDDILAVESTVDEIVTIIDVKETVSVTEDVLDEIVTEVVEKEEPVVIAEETPEEPELTDDILDVETTVDEIVTIIEVKETVAVTEDVLDEIVTDIVEKEEPVVIAEEITEEPESTDDIIAVESTVDEIITTVEIIPVAEDVLDEIVTDVVEKPDEVIEEESIAVEVEEVKEPVEEVEVEFGEEYMEFDDEIIGHIHIKRIDDVPRPDEIPTSISITTNRDRIYVGQNRELEFTWQEESEEPGSYIVDVVAQSTTFEDDLEKEEPMTEEMRTLIELDGALDAMSTVTISDHESEVEEPDKLPEVAFIDFPPPPPLELLEDDDELVSVSSRSSSSVSIETTHVIEIDESRVIEIFWREREEIEVEETVVDEEPVSVRSSRSSSASSQRHSIHIDDERKLELSWEVKDDKELAPESPALSRSSSISSKSATIQLNHEKFIALSWSYTPIEEPIIDDIIIEEPKIALPESPKSSRSSSVSSQPHSVRIDESRVIELSWQFKPKEDIEAVVEPVAVEEVIIEEIDVQPTEEAIEVLPAIDIAQQVEIEKRRVMLSWSHSPLEEPIQKDEPAIEVPLPEESPIIARKPSIGSQTESLYVDTGRTIELSWSHSAIVEPAVEEELPLVEPVVEVPAVIESPVISRSPSVASSKHSIRVDETRVIELSWTHSPIEEPAVEDVVAVDDIPVPASPALSRKSSTSSQKHNIRVDQNRVIELSWTYSPIEEPKIEEPVISETLEEIPVLPESPALSRTSSVSSEKHSIRVDSTRVIELSWTHSPIDATPETEETVEEQVVPVSSRSSSVSSSKHSVRVDETRVVELSWTYSPIEEPEVEELPAVVEKEAPTSPTMELSWTHTPIEEEPKPAPVTVIKTRPEPTIELSWTHTPIEEPEPVEYVEPSLAITEVPTSPVMELSWTHTPIEEPEVIEEPSPVVDTIVRRSTAPTIELSWTHTPIEPEVIEEVKPVEITTETPTSPVMELSWSHTPIEEPKPVEVARPVSTISDAPKSVIMELSWTHTPIEEPVAEPTPVEDLEEEIVAPVIVSESPISSRRSSVSCQRHTVRVDTSRMIELSWQVLERDEEDTAPITEIEPEPESPALSRTSSVSENRHSIRVDRSRIIELTWKDSSESVEDEIPITVEGSPKSIRSVSISSQSQSVRIDRSRVIELSWQVIPDEETVTDDVLPAADVESDEEVSRRSSISSYRHSIRVDKSRVIELTWTDNSAPVDDSIQKSYNVRVDKNREIELIWQDTPDGVSPSVEPVDEELAVVEESVNYEREVEIFEERQGYSIRVDKSREIELSWKADGVDFEVEPTTIDDTLISERSSPSVVDVEDVEIDFESSSRYSDDGRKYTVRVDRHRQIELVWNQTPAGSVVGPIKEYNYRIPIDNGRQLELSWEDVPDWKTDDLLNDIIDPVAKSIVETEIQPADDKPESLVVDKSKVHNKYLVRIDRKRELELMWRVVPIESPSVPLDDDVVIDREVNTPDEGTFADIEQMPYLSPNDEMSVVTTTDLDEDMSIEDFHAIHKEYIREVTHTHVEEDVCTYEELEKLQFLPATSASVDGLSQCFEDIQTMEEIAETENIPEDGVTSEQDKMQQVGQWICDMTSDNISDYETIYDIFWTPTIPPNTLIPSSTLANLSPKQPRKFSRLNDRDSSLPDSFEVTKSRSFLPNFASFLDDESFSRPKNLFFRNNSKMRSSIESLIDSGESDHSNSSESDEMTDDQLSEWYEHPKMIPTRRRTHSSNLSLCSESTNSVKRVGPLKSRDLIAVKPERIANLVIEIKEHPLEGVRSFKDFLKAAAIPTRITDEEAFFVYCYHYGRKKFNIIGRVNKEGRMVTVKAARRYRSRNIQKSDLSEEEIDSRLHDIATCMEDLPSSSRLSRDAIPYDRLEEDNDVLEDFVLSLQRKCSDPLTVAKWFIILNAVRQPHVESFLQFEETYFQLVHLTDHERFLIYSLIYGQKRWKVLLEKERRKVTGVYITFRDLPEYLRDHDEMSDKEVYRQLIKIALNDDPTRKELSRIGFQLPPKRRHGLPEHLNQWEETLSCLDQSLSSVEDLEKVLPKISLLSEDDRKLLFKYYSSINQEWNINVQKADSSGAPQNSYKTKTRGSKKNLHIPYNLLDSSDEPMDVFHIALGKHSVQPSRFAELFSKWATSPRVNVKTFEEFESAYPRLKSANEFERFIVFSSLYKNHKWKLIFEMNNKTQMTRLRLVLRHLHIDSDAFMAQYKIADKLKWLSSYTDKEPVLEWLRDSGFSIPVRYTLLNKNCVNELPTSLSDWLIKLNDSEYKEMNFAEFKNADLDVKVLRPEAQLILYTYSSGFQEWEIVIHDDLPRRVNSRLHAGSKVEVEELYAVPYKGDEAGFSNSTRRFSMNSDLFSTDRIIALPDFSAPKPVTGNADDDYEEIDLIRTSKVGARNQTKLMNKGTTYLQKYDHPIKVTNLDDDSDVEINDIASIHTDLDDYDDYDDVASAVTDLDDETYETPHDLPNLRELLER